MADSTTNRTDVEESIDVNRSKVLLKNSEVIAVNRYSGIDNSTGVAENADDQDDLLNYGIFSSETTGDQSNTTGDGSIEWTIRGGFVDKNVSVVGVSGRSDLNKLVYATDNQTLTLTRPASGTPIGIVHDHISGTTCDVYLFSRPEAVLMGYMGLDRKTLHLATVNSTALEGTSAIEIATDIPLHGHGKITDFYVVVNTKDSAAADGDQTFTLDIGASAVTGASISLDKDDAQGAIVSSTAITAANEFHNGDTVSLKMSSGGTGFSAGAMSLFSFYIEVDYLPGA